MPQQATERAGAREQHYGRAVGQSLVEFAAVAALFVMIVLGIVDLSRAIYARGVVAGAAREGARYGTTHKTDAPGMEKAARALVTGLDTSLLEVKVSHPDILHVQVEVTYTFQPISLLISRYMGTDSQSGLLLRGRSLMRVE